MRQGEDVRYWLNVSCNEVPLPYLDRTLSTSYHLTSFIFGTHDTQTLGIGFLLGKNKSKLTTFEKYQMHPHKFSMDADIHLNDLDIKFQTVQVKSWAGALVLNITHESINLNECVIPSRV